MIIMIVAIDQLIWRPLIVWSNKFKLEDTESEVQDRSVILRFLSRSTLFAPSAPISPGAGRPVPSPRRCTPRGRKLPSSPRLSAPVFRGAVCCCCPRWC